MVRPSFPAGALHATWLGDQIGLWIEHPEVQPRDIANVAIGVFGPDLRATIGERPQDVSLIEKMGSTPVMETVSALPVTVRPLAELMLPRSANQRWSPSISWLHHATLVATEIAVSGRAIPSLRTAGLRWRADWAAVADPEWEETVKQLADIVPPVMVAASEESVLDQVIKITNALVDAVSRFALHEQDWRPPLPRTRAASVVALRRVTTAWSGPDSIFLADSVAHESAFANWSTQLAEYSSRVLGAPDVSLQGRLEPPHLDDESLDGSAPWQLYLEVVATNGTVLGFEDIWDTTPEALELADAHGLVPLRQRMRELIDRLSSQLAALAVLAEEPNPNVLLLSIDEVSDLLSEGLEACRLAGLPILTPKGLLSRSARLTARAQTDTTFGRSMGLTQAMVNVDWGIALGDVSLTQEELEELARSSADIVALRGEWVQVDRRQMRAALKRLDTQRREASELTPAELLRETINEMGAGTGEDFTSEGWIADLLAGLPDDELTEAVEPAGFAGELRPYQRRALGWLQFLGRLGLGGCLADDMGLGKTPTALAHILERTLSRLHNNLPRLPHLVICPLSVVTNWENEATRFSPELSVMICHGADRPRGRKLIEAAANHDIVITTYGTASRITSELAPIPWDVIICDEAQAIKNHRTNAALAVRELHSQQRVALTGTPVENKLTELWAILDALNPGMLGGITWFRNQFANPIERGEDEEASTEALDSLRRLTAPFVLRRTKADRSLVPDLPDKIEQVAWSTLTTEQAGLYQAVLDDFVKSAAEATGMERRGLVLSTLTKLKQVCNHPAHFLREGAVGDGERSGKLERLDELLETIFEAGERTLIFTQYREMGLLLSSHIEAKFGHETPFLHGGTTLKKRQHMVDTFQSPEGPPVQLISLRAGGTGLNLTAASRVIHFDRWWNPAVEDQATDRTWRIGQDKTVFVHKLVCRGTLEERIDTMLTEKRALADAVVGTDESWLTELSTDELKELLRLDPSARQPVLI